MSIMSMSSRCQPFFQLCFMQWWQFGSNLPKVGACNRYQMRYTLATAPSVSMLAVASLVTMPINAQSQAIIIVGEASHALAQGQ
jgi:hypothetical protein